LERVDPGGHRRIKGLRLVTAYAIAAMVGTMVKLAHPVPGQAALPSLAGGFALWASVSEARATRMESCRDLLLLSAAAALGAMSFIVLAPPSLSFGHAGPELILVAGAFLVGYVRRFGLTGAGIGSQIFIGQLLACGAQLDAADVPTVALAGLIAAVASIVPRTLSGPAEHPQAIQAAPLPSRCRLRPETVIGLQGAVASLAIVAMDAAFTLTEAVWAITACTYVIAGSAAGTVDRVRRRLIGTAIGVPLGLACLPLASTAPLVLWAAAALAMVIYAVALPQRYDIACGAFAYTLIVTLAASGEHSIALLASRLWETFLGSALGLAAATLLLPLRLEQESAIARHQAP
jgi:hypothetical protein